LRTLLVVVLVALAAWPVGKFIGAHRVPVRPVTQAERDQACPFLTHGPVFNAEQTGALAILGR